MKRKIHALLLALLLVFSAALTAGAAGYSGSCKPGYRLWQQICTRYPGLCQPPASCTPSQPEAPAQPSQPDKPDAPDTPSEPDTPAQPDDGASVLAYEQEVVTLVNAERAKYGLSALTLDETLCGYARVKSQDMHDQGYFSHTSPRYGSPFDMMRSFGVSYQYAGENIAMGYSSPAGVVNAWMNSEGNRANILSANYTSIGVGYVADGGYWTQWFIG